MYKSLANLPQNKLEAIEDITKKYEKVRPYFDIMLHIITAAIETKKTLSLFCVIIIISLFLLLLLFFKPFPF